MVARTRSLARAATLMSLTVPALSRRIRLLEADLGLQLFQRLPRGLELTSAGQAYFAALAPAWDVVCGATEAARRGGRPRAIKVSVMPTFAANWLVPRLGSLHARHSGVEVELHTSADVEDLRVRSDLDCAIRLGKGPWPGLHCEPLLAVRAFPVASPTLRATGAWPTGPGDLLGRPLIGTHHQPAFWREWFAAMGIEDGPEDYRGFDNLQVVYEAAAAGMGIALGLEPVVRPYLDSGRLQRVLPGSVDLPRHFHLVRRLDGGTAVRGLARFREWLLAEVRAFDSGHVPAAGIASS